MEQISKDQIIGLCSLRVQVFYAQFSFSDPETWCFGLM